MIWISLGIVLTIISTYHEALGANILVLLPLDISSHHQFSMPIIRELAKRGHELTILTPIEDKKTPKNVKQILLPSMTIYEAIKDLDDSHRIDYFKEESMTPYANHKLVWNATLKITDFVMKSQTYQNFLANDKSKYDLVIYESFYHDAFISLAAKYKAPFVAISTFGHAHFINQFMGNPYEISYASHEFLGYTGKLKFIDRVKNFFWTSVELYERWMHLLPANYELAKQYSIIPHDDVPDIDSVQKNVSLVLTNSHFSMYGVRPLLPNIIEVGGVHIDDSAELPQDIKKYMDDAREGVIYFSFGTTIKSTYMPEDVVQMFVNIFSGLKQKVIWKWDGEQIKGKPSNVMTVKWVPQVAVLGHQNIKLFINQGGGLSMQESVSKGVPVLCIPLYGDQFGNCVRAEQDGYGETFAANKLNENDLKEAVENILEKKSYKENAKRVSDLYHDRPLTPMATAIYWVEYVIKHKGAPHMSSPAKDMYWYEYHSVDIMLLLGLLIYYTIALLNWMWWNVALRKPINRDHLIDLREQHKPKIPMKEE